MTAVDRTTGEIEPLTDTEQTRLRVEEAVVERGLHTFVQVGKALAAIRDERLYRQAHGTFEAYCEARWGLSRSRAYQLIDSAVITTTVSTIVDTPLPANEGQARELTGLDPETAAEVMREAGRVTAGKPTAEAIREARTAVASPMGDIQGERVDERDPVRNPVAEALTEAKARPSSHGTRAVHLLEKAHAEIKRAGGPEAIVADLEGDPLGPWDGELAVDTFDRLIPLLVTWQRALRHNNLRSVK